MGKKQQMLGVPWGYCCYEPRVAASALTSRGNSSVYSTKRTETLLTRRIAGHGSYNRGSIVYVVRPSNRSMYALVINQWVASFLSPQEFGAMESRTPAE